MRRVRYSERMVPAGDAQLVQIVDAAVADAARRSGSWLLCGPGCTQCCIGVFPISQLDAVRLRDGLASLAASDPARATSIRRRAESSVALLSPGFPGDLSTGTLDDNRAHLLDDFANDEPCPVLDPATGLCDLYGARPMTCRLFGPPLEVEGGLGVCELCFHGAQPDEIAACEVHLDCETLENSLTTAAEQTSHRTGSTFIAWALLSQP
jgi:Fe-S-cluster containining protein